MTAIAKTTEKTSIFSINMKDISAVSFSICEEAQTAMDKVVINKGMSSTSLTLSFPIIGDMIFNANAKTINNMDIPRETINCPNVIIFTLLSAIEESHIATAIAGNRSGINIIAKGLSTASIAFIIFFNPNEMTVNIKEIIMALHAC